MPRDNEIDLERYRRRHRKVLRQRAKDARQHHCEVICCHSGGPHRCGHRAGHKLDGHWVCRTHKILAPARAVFTVEEAIAIRRKDMEIRLNITQEE